jgi:hypothetical protein
MSLASLVRPITRSATQEKPCSLSSPSDSPNGEETRTPFRIDAEPDIAKSLPQQLASVCPQGLRFNSPLSLLLTKSDFGLSAFCFPPGEAVTLLLQMYFALYVEFRFVFVLFLATHARPTRIFVSHMGQLSQNRDVGTR